MVLLRTLFFCTVVSWPLASVRAVALIQKSPSQSDTPACQCAIALGFSDNPKPELELGDVEQVNLEESGKSCPESCQSWGNKWVTKSKAQLCGTALGSAGRFRQEEVGVAYKDQTMTEFVLGNVIQVPLASCAEKKRVTTTLRQNWNTTVDAQNAVDLENQTVVEEASPAKKKAPIVIYVKHFRELMLALGFYEPYVKSLFSMVDRVDIGDLADRFKMRFLFEKFKTAKKRFKYEVDAGLCFAEFLTHSFIGRRHEKILSVFSDMSKEVMEDSSARSLDLTPSLKSFIRMSSQNPQTQHLLERFFNMVFSAVASNNFPNASSTADEQLQQHHKNQFSRFAPTKTLRAKPEWQKVALDLVRFYLRRQMGSLSGSNVKREDVAEKKAAQDLAQGIEDVVKPFVISVLGVVPGAPASGHFINTRTFWEVPSEKVSSQPQERPGGSIFSPPFQTGNQFFDIGNTLFGNFHGATSNKHGFFCLKQYAVNKIWFKLQGFMKGYFRV